jgi:hypothetical protein
MQNVNKNVNQPLFPSTIAGAGFPESWKIGRSPFTILEIHPLSRSNAAASPTGGASAAEFGAVMKKEAQLRV